MAKLNSLTYISVTAILVLNLAAAAKYNPIDGCWRGQANWASDRMKLADCALGYGREAYGGQHGDYYVVTNSSDDPENPAPGTLRYGATRTSPTWIYFAKDMNIKLKAALHVSSYTTIDGRGASVAVADGPCLVLLSVRHVIVHGLTFRNCAGGFDGDAITIHASRHVWIDHNTLSSAFDGLIDVVHQSTDVTVSNNYFFNHDKVMLLGHSDSNPEDVAMRVTVAFNKFGPGLGQRMPRCRFGYFHVVNNEYSNGWSIYAIGGSAAPTIISNGNKFKALDKKQVTKCQDSIEHCKSWQWRSINDTFLNGAYFVQSGDPPKSFIDDGISFGSEFMSYMTQTSGALGCLPNAIC